MEQTPKGCFQDPSCFPTFFVSQQPTDNKNANLTTRNDMSEILSHWNSLESHFSRLSGNFSFYFRSINPNHAPHAP